MNPQPLAPLSNYIIGIDFDNTIINYDEVMYSLALKKQFIPLTVPKNKKDIRDAIRTLPEGDLKWQEIQAEAYGKAIMGATLHQGVREFLAACKQHQVPVYIVSHKTAYSHLSEGGVNLREAALSWMREQHFFDDPTLGLAPEQVYFESTREEKIRRLSQLGCTDFIDDLIEIFAGADFPAGVKKWLYDPQARQAPTEKIFLFHYWRALLDDFFPANSETNSEKTRDEFLPVVSDLIGKDALSLQEIGRGRNSRVYKVQCADGTNYVAKHYFRDHLDPRNRLGVEFNTLQFLWQHEITCVPKPIAMNLEQGWGIYEFIPGEKISSEDVTRDDIAVAGQFLAHLNQLKARPGPGLGPGSTLFLPASEACFSLQAVVASIEQRLQRLRTVPQQTVIEQKLHDFLQQQLQPSFEKIVRWCKYSLDRHGFSFYADLSPEERILSPSDFGFHNALRLDDGRIVFLDFEYFGWDDPAKTIADFLLHPGMSLPNDLQREFVLKMPKVFSGNPHLLGRVELVYPLFGLKWCTILLNEFVPEYLQRREFADQEIIEREQRQQQQLAKAEALLAKILREYESFPYFYATPVSKVKLDERSLQLREKVVEMVQKSTRRGHLPSAFSVMEILRVLYDKIMHYDPKNPHWPYRDRFILSKGHGCLALYVILAEKGFFPEEELWKFCKSDGILGGHPEHLIPGVEVSTGSLGHGLPLGVGFAINAKYEKNNSRTFVVIGDGESNEGSIWEAALCAGKHKLSNFTVIVDYNKQQSCNSTFEVQDLEPLADKWRSFGFEVREVDGHDVEELNEVFSHLPLEPRKPSAIICHTIKGKGIPFLERNFAWHHKSVITDDEFKGLYQGLRPGGRPA